MVIYPVYLYLNNASIWKNNNILAFMAIKKINGYRILLNQELGEGSYGRVYRGQQDKNKNQCAIKVVPKRKIQNDPYLTAALFSEIQILSKLKSPNIVAFYDVLESGHNYYLVQQLCCSDLESYLNKKPNNKLSQKEAIKILTEICSGFIPLLKEGIVHRDLKPANILLKKGVVKLADFGLAKQNIHPNIKNQSIVGTPRYMSIQLLTGQKYTSKCDVWALGCIFYEILHGNSPFPINPRQQMVEVLRSGVLQIDKKLSENTRDFLNKTLQIYEEDRISWDEIFKHQIFGGYYRQHIGENSQLEDKYKKIMVDLRFKINADNIDLKKMWEQLAYSQDKDLSLSEFQHFLQTVNPDITEAEETYFFEKMDVHGDGKISLKCLESQLQKYSISLRSKHGNRFSQISKTKSILTSEQPSELEIKSMKRDQDFEKKVENCFVKLNRILQSKKLTLFKTFLAYDSDNTGVLTLPEFSKILKKLDHSFTSDEIQVVFQLVDEDGSKTIEFDELNNYYCKINGIPVNLHLPEQYRSNKTSRKDNRKPLKKL